MFAKRFLSIALVALAIPALLRSGGPHVLFGAASAGGILGALLTEQLIEPQRAHCRIRRQRHSRERA